MMRLRVPAIICLLAFVPAVISFGWNFVRGNIATSFQIEKVSVTAVQNLPNPLWIDARSEAEYSEDHVPGAILLNEDVWNQGLVNVLDAWQPGRPIVVYCGDESCGKSEAVARRLKNDTQWKDIYILEGGWREWNREQRK